MHPEKLHQMLCCTATISNGFVARLTNEEATRMKGNFNIYIYTYQSIYNSYMMYTFCEKNEIFWPGMDGVVSIIPNRIHSSQTSRSGLPWSP